MTDPTTEVTTRIRAFTQGRSTEEDLVRYLTNEVCYAPTDACPHGRGTSEWYRWHEEGRPYTPGSFEEVTMAWHTGLLPWDTYLKISEAL